MNKESPNSSIPLDRLGPPGLAGELVIVSVMENEMRRDEARLQDKTHRSFKVFARLGKTALVADDIKGDFGPDDGESYVVLPPEAVAGRVRWDGHMMEFRKNREGEKSLVEFQCTSTSLREAKAAFLKFALPFLDNLAYELNCPIFVQAIRVEDVSNQVVSIDYVSPYRKTPVTMPIVQVPSELNPVFAMYREAKNSHSDFYKFLCYHKMLDGLIGTLRNSVNIRAQRRGLELTKRRDLVPDHSEIAPAYRTHIGKPIKSFYYDVLTPQFRNAIAHFITKDGAILNLSDPSTIAKHSEIMFVSELCVRVMIESHLDLLRQLNDLRSAPTQKAGSPP